MKSFTIGNVEVLPLADAGFGVPAEFLLPAHAAELTANHSESLVDGLVPLSVTTFLVRSGSRTYLVDTGVGGVQRENLPLGALDAQLREAGVAPSEIDVVIHTHLHGDHTGWNLLPDANGEWQFYFSKAVHYIQQKEWDYWMAPERLAATLKTRELVAPLAGGGRVRFQQSEGPIDEILVYIPTPGHTPGHVSIGIASAGERAVITGDVSHFTAQVEHPDWSPVFDIDPGLAAETRAKLMDACERDARTWFAGHYPYPGAGQILRVEGKRIFRGI